MTNVLAYDKRNLCICQMYSWLMTNVILAYDKRTSNLRIVVMITTIYKPFLTQTACALYIRSFSFNVLCVHWSQPKFDTTVLRKTFRLTWFSSAPLRIFATFACELLAQRSQTELGSCVNPRLSLHSMLAGWKTFLDGCHSFRASSMATPHLPFLKGTQHDKSLPSNPAVQKVKDLHHAGAVMFTRSTHCCGIWQAPAESSLELEGFRLQKQKGSEDSPGLKHPGALGRHERPARWQLNWYDKHIPGIC